MLWCLLQKVPNKDTSYQQLGSNLRIQLTIVKLTRIPLEL